MKTSVTAWKESASTRSVVAIAAWNAGFGRQFTAFPRPSHAVFIVEANVRATGSASVVLCCYGRPTGFVQASLTAARTRRAPIHSILGFYCPNVMYY